MNLYWQLLATGWKVEEGQENTLRFNRTDGSGTFLRLIRVKRG